jgi:hypothetical protein
MWTTAGRGGALLVYDLADPARPAFEQAAVPSWSRTVAVAGEYAYVPSGPYGVSVIPLHP